MKLACVAPILLAGCVTAFAPSASSSTSTSLYGAVGDEVRQARSSYAKPINYQRAGGVIGNDGSAVIPEGPVVAPYGEVGASVNGHDVRGARSSYAKPTNYHFTTSQIPATEGFGRSLSSLQGNSIRDTVNGHDVRGARSSYAKPTNYHFTTAQIPATEGFGRSLSSVHGNSIRDTVNGHDVRGARSSYAKATNYHFETREIGYDGNPRRQVNAASGPFVQQRVSPEFLPHSSTGAGDHSPPAPPAATAAEVAEVLSSPPAAPIAPPAAPMPSSGPPKSFGIGSWKK